MNEIIQKMFPTGILNGRGGSEVNGLTKGTVPVGTVLLNGQDKFDKKGRREFYAVEVDGHVALLRVCEAYPDSGYDEFAVVHRIVSKEDVAEVENIIQSVSRMIS